MKRVFGTIEVVFDLCYLLAALGMGIALTATAGGGGLRRLAGIMALLLALGDSFHLAPRIAAIVNREQERFRAAMGRGKQITSITMTFFYLLLWHMGVRLFAPRWAFLGYCAALCLVAIRIILCLLPQNMWKEERPPLLWGVVRNIPFFLLGLLVVGLFFQNRLSWPGLSFMWLAVLLSFAFYLPVVLWSNRNPKIGMLMLPKTCAYLWMLTMCFSL